MGFTGSEFTGYKSIYDRKKIAGLCRRVVRYCIPCRKEIYVHIIVVTLDM